MKQVLFNNIKNVWGWKTKRKIVVISVDDYGSIRLDSKEARNALEKAGLKGQSRFNMYDTLETREDLEILYQTLSSVKDKNGRNAVFTPFSIPCNIDFEMMKSTNYESYYFETLPETYNKLAVTNAGAYEGTWGMWKEGIEKGLMKPQFHGREHLNVRFLEAKLAEKDRDVLVALENRSYTSIPYDTNLKLDYSEAFDFWDVNENIKLQEILKDGLQQFERVFGFRATHFIPPSSKIHDSLLPILWKEGVKYIDRSLINNQHQGLGKYKRSISYTGKQEQEGLINIVRNVVFEPTEEKGFDWVGFSLKQIEVAFRWNRPAIISSHRVNFCGHIDPKNRMVGIIALKQLLDRIVEKWPNVEFMAANELGDLMEK
jgi:hypothetical protein